MTNASGSNWGGRGRHRNLLHHPPVFLYVILMAFLLPPGSGNSDLPSPGGSSSTSKCERADRSANSTNITCTIVPSENRTLSETVFQLLREKQVCFPESVLSKNVALTFLCLPRNSSLLPPTINFTRLSECLPHIHTFSAANCNLTKTSLKGRIPPSLKSLNLSHNQLETLPPELFQSDSKLELAQVDLRNNTQLANFPESFLNLTSIHRIWLGQHNLTCAWVAHRLFRWYKKNPDIFQDGESYECKTQKDETVVRLSLSGALKGKKLQTEHCANVTQSCRCTIYSVHKASNIGKGDFFSFKSFGADVYITLQVDCSNRSLTALPTLSPQVKFLNASHNQIKSLDELTSSTYANLKNLDVEFNEIENIDIIVKTQFVKHFDVLGLSHNRISELKPFVMKALLGPVDGHGRISLGENPIKCNCDTYWQVQPLLTKHRAKVDAKDAKLISCVNLKKIKVQELELQQVCDSGDENSQNHWYWIITIEAALIFMVIAKVWHDSHQYRQEGVLPWCSQKMPRLPCEFMLE